MDTHGSGRAAAPSERFNPRTFSGAVGATGHVQERSEPHHLHVEFLEKLLEGVQMLLSCAHRVMQQGPVAPVLQLPAPLEDPNDSEEAKD